MDNQNPIPNPQPSSSSIPVGVTPSYSGLPNGGPFASKTGGFGGGSGGGISPLILVLLVILGLGTAVFGTMAVVSYNKAAVATQTLNQQKAAAVALAKKEQRKLDDEANTLANESPFRSYVAPVEFGSFEIKFPKNWSGFVQLAQSGTQVSLVVNPDFVRRTNGTDELVAGRVQLIERTKDSYMQSYATPIKKGTLKQADITVSGLKAYDITGAFPDKKTNRQVVVPVRDKVLVITNENSKYGTEFNQILAQAKIIP